MQWKASACEAFLLHSSNMFLQLTNVKQQNKNRIHVLLINILIMKLTKEQKLFIPSSYECFACEMRRKFVFKQGTLTSQKLLTFAYNMPLECSNSSYVPSKCIENPKAILSLSKWIYSGALYWSAIDLLKSNSLFNGEKHSSY